MKKRSFVTAMFVAFTSMVALGIMSCADNNNPPAEVVSLQEITISTMPVKLEYEVGDEEFNTEGMVVTASYSNGTTKEVTDYAVSGFNSSVVVAEQIITITYTESGITKTAELKITIKPAVELSSISVTTRPTRLSTYVGARFEPEGNSNSS